MLQKTLYSVPGIDLRGGVGMEFLRVAVLSLLFVFVGVHSSRGNQILLDFEDFPNATSFFGPIDPPSSILGSLESDGILFGKPGKSTGVVVIQTSNGGQKVAGLAENDQLPSDGNFIGDIYFSFVVPGTTKLATTNAVSFTLGDSSQEHPDEFQIRVFDLADMLLTSIFLDSDDLDSDDRFRVSLSLSGIHRIEIDFDSSQNEFGYLLDDLSFNSPEAPVPEPSTLMLFSAGLIGLGILLQWKNWKKRL